MDTDAFHQATHALGDRIHGFAVWMLRDRDDAADVTQEAFLRLWVNRHGVETGSVRAWLLRTTHRLCIDRIRRTRRAPRSLGGLEETLVIGAPAGLASERREDLARAQRALEVLSVRERAMLLLREGQDLSHAELATVFDMPVGSIKTTLHRARLRVRDAIQRTEVAT